MLHHQVNFTKWAAADLEPEGYKPERLSYRSSVLELLGLSFGRMSAPSALNVGPLLPGLIDFMQERRGKICSFETDSGDKVIEALRCSPRSFDAIFLWDRLLYSDSGERDALLELVHLNSSMGSSLFLYTSTRRFIPACPSAFKFSQDLTITINPTTFLAAERPVLELKRIFPDWRSVRATQLRNGFREHLLVRGR